MIKSTITKCKQNTRRVHNTWSVYTQVIYTLLAPLPVIYIYDYVVGL